MIYFDDRYFIANEGGDYCLLFAVNEIVVIYLTTNYGCIFSTASHKPANTKTVPFQKQLDELRKQVEQLLKTGK